MKKYFIYCFFGLWLLIIISNISATKAASYPAGVIFSSPINGSLPGLGQPQSFPGGKALSSHCKDSEGYEHFPAGTLYPAASSVIDNYDNDPSFKSKYPTAFECDGNPRFYFGGELITETNAGTGSNSSGAVTIADPPKVEDIDFSILGVKFNTVPELVQGVITWLLGFAGAFAVIALVYSGIMYITAGADQTKAETAKKNLVWAITGIVVILLAYAIVRWVGSIISSGSA